MMIFCLFRWDEPEPAGAASARDEAAPAGGGFALPAFATVFST
jgi:hypothetical protein